MKRVAAGFLASSASLVALGACQRPQAGAPDAQASPQALATPAPLSSIAAPQASALSASDAGPPPLPLRFDRALPPDSLADKNVPGCSLDAVLSPIEPPPPPRGADLAQPALDALRRKVEPHLRIDLGSGRLRVALASSGFVLPAGTEIRARADRYGQIVVAPDGAAYRVLAPSVLRALVGERRLDVSPLSGAEVAPRGEGSRLGARTRKVEVTTRAGKGSFELAKVPEAGDSGVVLARILASLLDAPPATTVALEGEVPVRLELVWTTAEKGARGGILFEATSLTRRLDLAPKDLAVPPWGAVFTDAPLPAASSELFATPAEIAAIHNGPPGAEARGPLALANSTDQLRYAFLEGAPVAWLAPHARIELPHMPKGKYQVTWRSFLGDAVDPPHTVDVPGASDAAGADAGP